MALDLATCINAGTCIAVSKIAYYTMIDVFVIVGILLVLLLLIFFWTPALIFLKAKIFKKSIIYDVNRAQRGRFLVGKESGEGIIEVPRVGIDHLTEDSHTITNNGLNLFFAFSEFVSTIPLTWPAVVTALRETTIVSEWEDYKKIIDDLKETGKLTEKELEAYELQIRPYKTIKLHDLAYMFPYNWSPSLVESRLENKLAQKTRAWAGALNMERAVVIVVIFVGMVIASVILWKFFGSGGETIVQISPGVIQAAATPGVTG